MLRATLVAALAATAAVLTACPAEAADPPPVVASVEPDGIVGVDAEGELVTVHGVRFTGTTQVEFGEGNPAPHASIPGSGRLSVTVPGGSGTVDLIVTRTDGTLGLLEGAFTYLPTPPPEIVSIDPVAGLAPLIVTVSCAGLRTPAAVEFGDRPIASTSVGADVIYAQFSDEAASTTGETVPVTVTNFDGQSDSVQRGFTFLPVPPPIVHTVTPHATHAGGYVEIFGESFDGPEVVFGPIPPAHASVGGDWMYVWLPVEVPDDAIPGTHDVIVTNSDGQSYTVPDGFTVLPLVVDRMTPHYGPAGGSVRIYWTRKRTTDLTGLHVYFGATHAPNMTAFRDGTGIAVQVPAGSGVVDVSVLGPDGTNVLQDAFAYGSSPPPPLPPLTPVVTSLSTSAGREALGVTIHGSGFERDATVEFGTGDAIVAPQTPSEVFAVVPAGEGTVDVTVTNPSGGTATLQGGFTYLPPPHPVISGVSPGTGGPPLGMDIVGVNFAHDATVEFGPGNFAQYVSFRTREHVFVVVPDGTGTVDVIVTNPNDPDDPADDQKAVLEDGFSYE